MAITSSVNQNELITSVISTDQVRSWPVRILLHTDVNVWSQAGESLRPKARKAQALLAIIGLWRGILAPRARVANLLWSASEPAVRLARLRDLVHGLKYSIGQTGADVLNTVGDGIGFRPGSVHLEFGLMDEDSALEIAPARFLGDLDGIDPALDQWLANLRLDRRYLMNGADLPKLQAETKASRGASSRCTLAVAAMVTVESDNFDPTDDMLSQISRTLTRFRWFRTITRDARGRSLRVGDQDLSLLADYALVGTIRSAGEGFELFIELIAFSDNLGVVWTRSLKMTREVNRAEQNDVAERIAAQVDTELLTAEATHSRRPLPVNDQDSYRLVLRAVPAIYQLEREKFLGVGHFLEQAVDADPDSAFAHSWLAYWYIFLVGQGWARNPGQVMAKAGRAADRAMVLDPRDAHGFTVAGHVRAFIARHLDEAAALHDIALQLNPSLPLAWHLAGMTSAYAGRLDKALSQMEHCRKLAELGPGSFLFEGGLAIVHLLKREHEQSAEIGRRVTQRHPNFTSAYKSTISALGHLGERTAAQRLVDRLKQLEPHFTLRSFQANALYRRREDLAHFAAGLRLGGVI